MEKKESHFKVKKISAIDELTLDSILPTSDFLVTDSKGKVVQFEYIDPNAGADNKRIVTSGVYTLYLDRDTHEIKHKPISFNSDKIFKEYSFTESITKLVSKFFSKINIYEKRGMFPKRAALLYGEPGCSKTTSIIETVHQYMDGETVAIIWPTAVLRAAHVKEFFTESNFKDVKRLIMIIEDVGGGEKQYFGDKMAVDSELLSLLDNSTNTFSVPTMILATTNYPANLLEPLLRTGRFDDLLEIKSPNAEQRVALLNFFAGDLLVSDKLILEELKKSKYDKLSVSDLKEITLKAELDDTSIVAALESLMKRKKLIEEDFAKARKALGFDEL